uniref:Atypical/PIKK/TRRAP protein kinase n=1 Tax=Ganoderma boninense TaxID=34458 RepID=A0A5K1K653_9APHY|nr:Atypical/PIKK/TRRAP protein kinase [Ganoderma boninense]
MISVIAYHLDPTTTKAGPNFVFEAISNDFEYGCLVPLVAIYPTTIIAIVALKQSPIDTGGLSQVRQAQVHRRGSGPVSAAQGGTASTIVFNHSTGVYNPSVVVDIQSTIEQKPTPAGYGSTHSRETSRSEDETKIMPENLV